MEKMERKIQEVAFDVEIQYCNPDECLHDCKREGTNNCDMVITSLLMDLRGLEPRTDRL